jgi:hypothetical protein
MLNNSAASQGDNFQGLGFSQYGQNMTSALNNPQTGYAATNVHSKRTGQTLHQQSQLQPGLSANARRAGQRQTMQPHYQYPQGRGGLQLPASNAPMIRPGQAALQSQYQLQSGLANRGNLQQTATTAANVRALGQPGHSALAQMSAVHGDVPYGNQGHHVSQRYGLQQPPAHLQQQEHQQRAHASVANSRFDLSSVQPSVPTSTPGSMYVHHNQHMAMSEAYRARPNAPPATTAQARRVLQTRVEHPTGDKVTETLLDSSDFPTLGGLPNRAPGQVDAAANGISNLSIHTSLHMGGKGNPPLDSNDFPALNAQGGRMPTSYLLQNTAAGRAGQGEVPPMPVAANDVYDVGGSRLGHVEAQDDGQLHGLKGLLPHIRNENPCESYTALGGDLAAMGLDLSSNEPLYPSLSSPWSAGGRMGEVDIQLPHWFLFDPPNLHQLSLSRMSINSVFNIFYIFAGTLLTLSACLRVSLCTLNEQQHCPRVLVAEHGSLHVHGDASAILCVCCR